MNSKANPIPQGYHSVTASLTFANSTKALEFYQAAFGAKVIDHLPSPDGKRTMHATMKIGDSIVMMGDEMPNPECSKSAETMGGSPVSLYLYVQNVDTFFEHAVAAGAHTVMPVSDMFWGDRCGTIKDPFGYTWMVATHIKDLSQDEIQKGAQAFFAQMAKK